jgi:Trk K+ transport system NAD-binding subunit
VIIDNDEPTIERVRGVGHTVHIGDGTSTEVLEAAGAENAKTLVAATGDDDANLLIAQLAHSTFDIERLIARVSTAEKSLRSRIWGSKRSHQRSQPPGRSTIGSSVPH